MKALFLINSLAGGGAERVVKTLSEHLVKKGCKVTIVTLQDSNKAYSLDGNIVTKTLYTKIMNKGLFKLFALPLQAIEYKRLLKREKPDIAVSFLVRSNFVNVISSWFGNKRPIIISERTTSNKQYNTRTIKGIIMRKLISFLYPKSSRIIAISRGVKESLISLGIPPRKIKVIHNPQDLNYITSQSNKTGPVKFGRTEKIIVTMGRLIELKDHKTLIRAFANLNNQDIKLFIIGEGPMKTELQNFARKLNIFNKVHFLGWVKNPFPILKNSDVFVLTSKFEGFGNVLVEAMACHTPVISSDCDSGPREILGKSEYGILFPVGDYEELAIKIAELLDSEKSKMWYKQKGYERAKDFDVNVIAKKYINFS